MTAARRAISSRTYVPIRPGLAERIDHGSGPGSRAVYAITDMGKAQA